MTPPDRSIMREAADWFTRMRGPEAASSRRAFERWLATGDAHREAYSRVAETFSLGKHLARVDPPNADPTGKRRRAVRLSVAAAAAALVGIAGLSLLSISDARGPAEAAMDRAGQSLQTRTGEIRTVMLGDGSRVTLDTDTELALAFSASRRTLRMIRGRARFDVAHDRRPFVVDTSGGAIVARGTLFDVRVDGDRAQVQLLRGAIDVERAPRAGQSRVVRRLAPGQAVAFGASHEIAPPTPLDRPQIVQPGWPQALLAFDRVTVTDLAAEANRYSTARLLVDPDLASASVSGTFRVGDPARLADRLASLVGSDLIRRPNGDIMLSPRKRAAGTPGDARPR